MASASQANEQAPGPTRSGRTLLRRLRRGAPTASLGLAGLWVIGQVFRDGNALTALCFYLPSPFVLVVLLAGAVLARGSARRVLALACALTSFAPLWFVLKIENRPSPGPSSAGNPTLRVVHWNVFGGQLGWDGVLQRARREDPDLVVLSEVPPEMDSREAGKVFGEGWNGIHISNLAILAQGELLSGRWLMRKDGIRIYGVIWTSVRGSCRLLVVDLPSSLATSRAPGLQAVARAIATWHPDLVVGDFNAPRRSLPLTRLPPGYTHAYETVGSGWSYTWPAPITMLAIDQCIVGPRILPSSYRLETSLRSDHRLQVLDFSLRSPPPEPIH